MPELVQIGSQPHTTACPPVQHSHAVLWIQSVTLAWMLIECGASLYAAAAAHSPAMLAFGSDSLVELLSATLVLLQFSSPKMVSEEKAARIAGACFSFSPLSSHARLCFLWCFTSDPKRVTWGCWLRLQRSLRCPFWPP